MKKLILLIAIFTVSTQAALAQFSYGVKAGANIASVSNLGDIMAGAVASEMLVLDVGKWSGDGKIGAVDLPLFYHFGVFGEYRFGRWFGAAAEVVYSVQGDKAKAYGNYERLKYNSVIKARISYLNVPVLAKLYLTKRFSIDAGPQVGFLLSSKNSVSMTVNGVKTSASEHSTDGLQKVDCSVAAGVSYNFGHFLVQARYNFGLNEVFTKEAEYTMPGYGSIKFSNRVVQAGVGYRF